MNRIAERFSRLKKQGQKGFIVYIGAGDPNLEMTRRLALAFDQIGVDVLELGVPFSDPLADGLVNQLAAQRGLESGTTPAKVLQTVAAIRRDSQIPIVLYIYFNLIHRHGLEKFIADAAAAGRGRVAGAGSAAGGIGQLRGADGQAGLCRHLPRRAHHAGIAHRTDRPARQRDSSITFPAKASPACKQNVSETIGDMIAKIRAHTDLPIAVGFGISTPEQARLVAARRRRRAWWAAPSSIK